MHVGIGRAPARAHLSWTPASVGTCLVRTLGDESRQWLQHCYIVVFGATR